MVVTNNTFKSQTIGVGPVQCVVGVGLVLRDATGSRRRPTFVHVGCDDVGRNLARNQTVTIPASLPTAVRCDCRRASYEGRFELRLERDAGLSHHGPPAGSIGAMPIFVRRPERDRPPDRSRHERRIPGDEITGSLELDNRSDGPVEVPQWV